MFVVASDFDRQPFNLIGLSTLDAGEFDDFVSYHEEENLREVLGNLFWNAMIDGLAELDEDLDLFVAGNYLVDNEVVYLVDDVADVYICIQETTGQLPTDTDYWTKQDPNRWVRLKWGDSFVYNNSVPQKWWGFNRIIVPLIYSLWTKFNADKPTASGTVVLAKENSNTISPNDRIIRGWNKYSYLIGGENARLGNFEIWFNANYQQIKDTLFGYLYCKSTDFDDLVSTTNLSSFKSYLSCEFKSPGRMNWLDL